MKRLHIRAFVAMAMGASALIASQNSKASTIAAVETQASSTPASIGDVSTPIITNIFSQPGTVNGKTYTSYAIFANDGTGSIDLFGKLPTGSGYNPTVGDAISASGTYSPFDSIPEIATLTALSSSSSGNAVPAPATATIPQINQVPLASNVMGYPLNLDNVTISGITATTFGITNLTGTVTDSSSNSMTLFYWPTSYSLANQNLFGQSIPTGPVNIFGFADVFTSGSTSTVEFVPINITPAVVAPEPSSFVLAGLAIGALLLTRRRRAA